MPAAQRGMGTTPEGAAASWGASGSSHAALEAQSTHCWASTPDATAGQGAGQSAAASSGSSRSRHRCVTSRSPPSTRPSAQPWAAPGGTSARPWVQPPAQLCCPAAAPERSRPTMAAGQRWGSRRSHPRAKPPPSQGGLLAPPPPSCTRAGPWGQLRGARATSFAPSLAHQQPASRPQHCRCPPGRLRPRRGEFAPVRLWMGGC